MANTPAKATRQLPTEQRPLPSFEQTSGWSNLVSLKSWSNTLPEEEREKEALLSLCGSVLKTLEPASGPEVSLTLEGLAAHYTMKPLTAAQTKMWLADWRADLEEIPADILLAAVAEYRRAPNAFFPTPGQILAVARPILAARKTITDIAAAVLTWPITEVECRGATFAVPPGGNPQMWGTWDRPGVAQQLEWIEKRRRSGWDEKWGSEPERHDTRVWPSVIAYMLATAPWYLKVSAAPNAEWRASPAVRMDQP